MTKEEAIQEMKKGKKLTHVYFTPEEWVYIGNDGRYVLEDGVEVTPSEFWMWRVAIEWNEDWELVIETKN